MAIRRRPDQGLLASLYELPNLSGWQEADRALEAYRIPESQVEAVEPLPEAKHIFSHVEWHMKGFLIRLKPDGEKSEKTGRGLLFCRETADSHILRPAWSFCCLTLL